MLRGKVPGTAGPLPQVPLRLCLPHSHCLLWSCTEPCSLLDDCVPLPPGLRDIDLVCALPPCLVCSTVSLSLQLLLDHWARGRCDQRQRAPHRYRRGGEQRLCVMAYERRGWLHALRPLGSQPAWHCRQAAECYISGVHATTPPATPSSGNPSCTSMHCRWSRRWWGTTCAPRLQLCRWSTPSRAP